MADAKRDLEALAAELPKGAARDLVERVLTDPYEAARAALWVAIHLGAAENWDGGADYLEAVADDIGYSQTFNHPGDDDNKALYRAIADAAGIGYTKDEEEES